MKSFVARLIDCILLGGVVFFASFLWARMWADASVSAVIAAIATISAVGLIRSVSKPKTDLRHLEEVKNQLLLDDRASTERFLIQLLSKANPNKSVLLQDGQIAIGDEVFVLRLARKLSFEDIVDIISKNSPLVKLYVITFFGVLPQAQALIASAPKPIKVWGFAQLYAMMKAQGSFPTITVKLTKPKRKKGELVRQSLSQRNTRRYIFAGLIMLAYSYLFVFSPYFLIMGSVCIALAIYCFLFGEKISI